MNNNNASSFLTKLDLNLFRCFAMIYQERNLTRAAERLHISQSAVSHALSRMREQMGDQLFVREAQGVIPTPLARQIWPDVEEGLRALFRAAHLTGTFDPARHVEQITIAMNDEIEPILLPLFIGQLRRQGLAINVFSVRLDRSSLQSDLATGRLDCAIDVARVADTHLRHRRLSRDEYVVVSRQNYTINVDDYLRAEHVIVSSRRTGHTYEDMELGRQGIHRKVMARCQHYQSAWRLVSQSEALLTMPRSLAESSNEPLTNFVHDLPIPISPVEIHLYWHRDKETNPTLQWLREIWSGVAEQLGNAIERGI